MLLLQNHAVKVGISSSELIDSLSPQFPQKLYDKIFRFQFLPPGRGLWAMGTPLTNEKHMYAALNNCAFVTTKTHKQQQWEKPFEFLMDSLMLGIGVGFDTKGADNIPISKPSQSGLQTFRIPDSRQGWVKSVGMLLRSYFNPDFYEIEFKYDLIRERGLPLKVFGGVSSGPQPLIDLHLELRSLLNRALSRGKGTLNSRDIVDIMNVIGKCVVAGNIRRSAQIAFGQEKDSEFLALKDYNLNPERAAYGWASNNSVFVSRGSEYGQIAKLITANGEPGVAWLDNMRNYSRMGQPPDYKDTKAMGGNPCLEQTLEPYEMCTLVQTFPASHSSLEQFKETLTFAYFYAKVVTLGEVHWQESKEVMTRNRRIGCSMSGVAQFIQKHSLSQLSSWCAAGYAHITDFDRFLSQKLKVPESLKKTSVKPSGTVSLLAGATPGVHFPLSRFYIRRVRLSLTSETLIQNLKTRGYKVEPDVLSPDTTAIVEFPIDLGSGIRTLGEVSLKEQLELAALMQSQWADNQVSCTATFDPDKGEDSQLIAKYLREFESRLKGISFLPKSQDIYPQMPYEEIGEQEYQRESQRIEQKNGLRGTEEAEGDDYCDVCAQK